MNDEDMLVPFDGRAWKRMQERTEEALLDLMSGPLCSTATTGVASTSTLEAAGMLELMEEAQRQMGIFQDARRGLSLPAAFPPSAMFAGIPVYESPYATMTVPVRRHKRGNQNAGYHARVQKKWTKRYGTRQEPCVYVIGPELNRQLLMDAQHVVRLRGLAGA